MFPLYQQKTGTDKIIDLIIDYKFVGNNTEPLEENESLCIASAVASIRLAAKIIDSPCNQMHTDIFLNVRKQKDHFIL